MKRTATAALAASLGLSSGVFAGGDHHGAHWGYEGHSGPAHWAEMSQEYSLCGSGKHQSPIDISKTSSKGLAPIQFDYRGTELDIVNNGHTIQVNRGQGSSITVNGEKYELLQFHFHTPSENAVNGKAFPMEMHLVHKNAQGELAVVGVFFQAGSENAGLAKAWGHMPHHAGDKDHVAAVSINAADLLPAKQAYYSFTGSLTTPPCSEGVKWMVMQAPVQASQAQIEQFTHTIGANARPVQALNDRTVSAAM